MTNCRSVHAYLSACDLLMCGYFSCESYTPCPHLTSQSTATVQGYCATTEADATGPTTAASALLATRGATVNTAAVSLWVARYSAGQIVSSSGCSGPIKSTMLDVQYCIASTCTGSILCLNGGTCTIYGYCSCPFGYTGLICETGEIRCSDLWQWWLLRLLIIFTFIISAQSVWFVQRDNLLQQWNMPERVLCLSIPIHWIRLLNKYL